MLRSSDAQKAEITEMRSLYGARLAQADLQFQDRLRATFDPAVHEALEAEYRRERERLSAEMDTKIEKARAVVSGAPPRRVLVVEDELAIRELLRLHLEARRLRARGDRRRAPRARRRAGAPVRSRSCST